MPVAAHRRLSQRGRRGGLVALVVLGLLVAAAPRVGEAAPGQGAGGGYAASTGHILADPFFSYWASHEGMTVLGLPVTEPVAWQGGKAQFFQRGGLQEVVTQPGGKGTISPIPVGQDLLTGHQSSTSGATVAGRYVGDPHVAGPVLLQAAVAPPTGQHVVADAFKAYYDLQGGAQRFGAPISDPTTLNGVTVQWFEFGRLELATDGSGAVTPAPVGQELAQALELPIGKVAQGQQPLLDTKRYRVYQGDGKIPQALTPFDPVHITMPSINVDANIEQVPITNGVMGIPQNAWNVGWYPDLSQPGHDTNVVMAGHKDWWGIGPTIFANLQDLSVGDKIYLTNADGSGFTYEVTSVDSVDANTSAAGIVDDTGSESLTLITCTGSFDGQEYASRLIVRAQRM